MASALLNSIVLVIHISLVCVIGSVFLHSRSDRHRTLLFWTVNIYKKIRNIEQTYCTVFSQNTTLFIKIHTNKVSMLFFDFVRENPNISTIGGIVSRSSYLLISIPYDHSRHDRADHSPLRSSPPQADRCRQGNRIRYHHPRLREQGATISLRGHHCMTWKTRQRLSTPKNRPPKRRSSDIRTVFLRWCESGRYHLQARLSWVYTGED